jgi:two-component system, NarL family, invasion response regulator UvrY
MGGMKGDTPVRVLIVDDQKPFRSAAKTVVLVTPGFEVVGEAESGEEGVDMAASLLPDLVLMDINLPGINGIEAVRRIRSSNPETVAFLLSTYRVEDLPADARSSGAVAYIHKEEFGPAMLSSLWDSGGDPDWHAA